jgi:tetratricopeptide (TPR) repeat protein
MTKLSLSIVVKNEEIALPKCLESVKNVVDEMIIMDTGSSDRTVEIAKEFGAKILHFDWCNDFSAARNEALNSVSGEWVLVLDADEVLAPEIVPQMQQAMEDENAIVINLIRHEIGATQSPYSLVSRLFRNHPEVKFTRPYHSIVDDRVAQLLKKELHWKVIDLTPIAILHYGYTPEAIQALDKYTRARKAMEGFFAAHPNDPYVCSKLGGLYLQIGEEKKGIKLLKQGLKSNQADEHVLFELHYHLGNAYARKQEIEAAIKHYKKAMEQPILPLLKIGAYNNFGSLLKEIGDLKNALQAYEIVIKTDPNFALSYYNLGGTFKAMERFQDAIAAYQKAIKLNPDYAFAYQNLGVVLLKAGNYSDSMESFKIAIALHETQNLQEAERLRQELKKIGMNL